LLASFADNFFRSSNNIGRSFLINFLIYDILLLILCLLMNPISPNTVIPSNNVFNVETLSYDIFVYLDVISLRFSSNSFISP